MTKTTQRGQLEPAVQHASHLAKPQLAFKHPVNNNDEPWYPALSHKFNAQVPLGHIYRDSDADAIVCVPSFSFHTLANMSTQEPPVSL